MPQAHKYQVEWAVAEDPMEDISKCFFTEIAARAFIDQHLEDAAARWLWARLVDTETRDVLYWSGVR